MRKNIWGKHVWKALHYIALGYPNNPTKEQKKDYKQFYILLKSVLPCKFCREHYIENLKNHPITNKNLKNKESLVKWTIDLHNLVNKQLGYPLLSYKNALNELLDKSYEVCLNNNKWNIKKKNL